jgi:phage baseplate assembly protein W
MAIVLGSKPVRDTKKFDSYAYGITLPIQIGNTAFEQAFTVEQQIKSNIKNLLLTKKLERVMNPEFGSGLHELLFNQNDGVLVEDLEGTIRESVERWLPYVIISNIDIQSTNSMKDTYQISARIDFRLRNDPNVLAVTITL